MNIETLYTQARAAGLLAAQAAQVTPMIVNAHKNPLDANSEITQSYFVADGVCGFASVVVKNIKFANGLKKMNIGRKNYGGGYCISVQDFNQSLTRKEVYAHAFAEVLRANGVDAYVDSRMD
jgi:hypothetical protein